ncbi:MAG: hypothetical protein ACRCX8_18175, partial [Sarcina sp.]
MELLFPEKFRILELLDETKIKKDSDLIKQITLNENINYEEYYEIIRRYLQTQEKNLAKNLKFYIRDFKNKYPTEYFQLKYLLYKVDKDLNINVMQAYSKPSLELVDSSFIGQVTKLGYITEYLKQNLRYKIDSYIWHSYDQFLVETITSWEYFLKDILSIYEKNLNNPLINQFNNSLFEIIEDF